VKLDFNLISSQNTIDVGIFFFIFKKKRKMYFKAGVFALRTSIRLKKKKKHTA
jgi:hypothetical protein